MPEKPQPILPDSEASSASTGRRRPRKTTDAQTNRQGGQITPFRDFFIPNDQVQGEAVKDTPLRLLKRSEEPDSDGVSDETLRRQKLIKIKRIALSQVLIVPIVLSGVYFYGIARNRYVTRSDFVIRKAEESESPANSSLISLLGRSDQLSLEDARFLKTYLQSPQVLSDLSRSYDLDKAYARDGRDPLAGIAPGLSPEKRLRFFKNQVSVSLDEMSGAIALYTVGLNPKASFDLNRFMLAKSEEFVNRLNQDISHKQLGFAEQELKLSRAKLEAAKNRLITYQNANRVVIDPKGEAQLASGLINQFQSRLVDKRVALATLKRQYKDPNEPEVLALVDEVRELEKQISKEASSLVSTRGRNINRRAADVVKLESDLTFATDNYKIALASVEKARIEGKRQQKFMAMLSAPQLPEDPENRWRSKGFFSVVAILVLGFSLTKFVLGMQASHRQ